jgi:lipopolysaccharide biosynthesis glycosyltransferase
VTASKELLDQDYINHVFDGDIATLDESWNYMSDHIYAASMTLQRRMQTSLEMGRAVVQHFHANAKPWSDQVSLSSGAAMQIHTSSFYTHCDAVRASLGDNWVSGTTELPCMAILITKPVLVNKLKALIYNNKPLRRL